jgi:DMSO/TMAO reductase YedYZ molybdopterin-dependent catalytic subunit
VPEAGPVDGAPVGRRLVLGLLGFGVVGTVAGSRLQTVMTDALAPLQLADPTGLLSLLPVGNAFRYYSVTGGVQHRSAATYRLEVSGLVRKPETLTVADLQAMPQTTLVRDFQCVTGWRVPEVRWTGVRLSDVLDRVAPMSSATAVRFTSFDGVYSESLTMEQARRSDVLVALEMLGKPVTHNHGGPVRLYVAPMYGYKSIKWMSGIELTREVVPGYWEGRGYSIDGFVGHSNGRDDAPTS